MKQTLIVGFALLMLTCRGVLAQEPLDDDAVQRDAPVVDVPAPPAPGAWPVAHDSRRYDSAKEAVRRKAEWKSAQRRARIAAMKWLGYSPLRPPASPVPFMGASSAWVSGVGVHYRWPGVYFPLGVAAAEEVTITR